MPTNQPEEGRPNYETLKSETKDFDANVRMAVELVRVTGGRSRSPQTDFISVTRLVRHRDGSMMRKWRVSIPMDPEVRAFLASQLVSIGS